MIENIKSLYITKLLFSFIQEVTKLHLARFNKCLQNKLGLSLINYKLFSGYKIEYSSKNYGKQYGGNYIYEGEFLNGKKNGKGKEYYNQNILAFEGEYLNGKRNGKGKEYYNKRDDDYDDESNKLKFEGEYINGKEWNGKGYDINNKFSYEIQEEKGFVKKFDDSENFYMVIKEKANYILMENQNMKVNIYLIENITEKDMMKKEI